MRKKGTASFKRLLLPIQLFQDQIKRRSKMCFAIKGRAVMMGKKMMKMIWNGPQ